MEEWKDVIGFEGRFKISNSGNLISINGRYKGERLLSPAIDGSGYYLTNLRMNSKNKYCRIHQLVAEHFLVKPENISHICVNHIDSNKLNNHVSNLEWISKRENCIHARNIGPVDFNGEKSPNSKLKESDVLLIRSLSNQGFSSTQIAGKLNSVVQRRHITDIINRVNWKNI